MENNYTVEIEDVLKDYALEAESLYVIHNKCFLRYHYKGYYYVLPVIVLTTISGVLSFNHTVQSNIIGQYMIGGINIFSGILTTIYKWFNYANYENQHKLLSIEYLHLYEEIKSVLSRNPANRPDALKYIDKIETKRQELFDNFSIINDKIRHEFKHKHKNLELPLKLNHIKNISIYGRDKASIIESEDSNNSVFV